MGTYLCNIYVMTMCVQQRTWGVWRVWQRHQPRPAFMCWRRNEDPWGMTRLSIRTQLELLLQAESSLFLLGSLSSRVAALCWMLQRKPWSWTFFVKWKLCFHLFWKGNKLKSKMLLAISASSGNYKASTPGYIAIVLNRVLETTSECCCMNQFAPFLGIED